MKILLYQMKCVSDSTNGELKVDKNYVE